MAKKTVAKKAVKKASKKTTPPAAASSDGVIVHMYRQGLGDCLLLTFNPGPDQRHVLIDCGTLGNSVDKTVSIQAVMEDVRQQTNGQLDLLVVTHEHKDHVMGLNSQRALFVDGKIKVKRVWQAWTEKPGDPDAEKLHRYKQDLGVRLAAMIASPAAAEAVPEVVDLLGFFGDAHALAAGKFAETVDAAMKFMRDKLTDDVTFCEPAKTAAAPLTPPWLPGWRVYVLGPPRDIASLNDTGEGDATGLYGIAAAGRASAASLRRAAAADVDDTLAVPDDEDQMPFDIRFRRPAAAAPSRLPDYFAEREQWRTIEDDYLRPVSDLALQLDDLTNNTSLALAFERLRDGRVLLFPADAQRGNWLSWQKLAWVVDGKTITVNDLLARTVFYKVGHHGSHNATPKQDGLGRMTNAKELVAFIPVDRAIALNRNPKNSWMMPAVPLYRPLLEHCQGRVARSDLGWAAAPPAGKVEEAFKGLATAAEWAAWAAKQTAAANVKVTKLYLEFTLRPA